MSTWISSSIIIGQKCVSVNMLRPQVLPWNPISGFAATSNSEMINFRVWGSKSRVQHDYTTKRNSSVVYADSVPRDPSSSGPPPSSYPMSWIGMVVSFILPFLTNKWGQLWVIKNKIDNAVQTVENITEAVEKVAEGVDKIAEDIAEDLPQGNLRDLVELVENVAEGTAKTANSLDNIIDKVQEAEDQMEDIVECVINEAKNSPKGANDH